MNKEMYYRSLWEIFIEGIRTQAIDDLLSRLPDNAYVRMDYLKAVAEELKKDRNTPQIDDIIAGTDTKRKETNLNYKCGSCKWATPRNATGSYINCKCPAKRPNWFARTNPSCKKYERKETE